MITLEMLNGNEGLKGLTPDQKEAIVTLSRNDENAVIGERFGEVYRQMDETIVNALGIPRNGDEKTYLYLQRAANEFKGKYADYDGLKGQIDSLKNEKAALEAKIESGAGDSSLKEQYENVKKELQATKEQFNTLKGEKDALEAQHKQQLMGLRIDAEMAKAKDGLKFRSGMSEAAIQSLVDAAVVKVKGYSPKFETDNNGKENLRFYDSNGVIMNNPDNNLNPFTPKELLLRELKPYDIIDNAARGGAGGNQTPPSRATGFSGSTREQAVAEIEKELATKGFVKGTEAYENEMFRLYEENNIDSLPLQ